MSLLEIIELAKLVVTETLRLVVLASASVGLLGADDLVPLATIWLDVVELLAT